MVKQYTRLRNQHAFAFVILICVKKVSDLITVYMNLFPHYHDYACFDSIQRVLLEWSFNTKFMKRAFGEFHKFHIK